MDLNLLLRVRCPSGPEPAGKNLSATHNKRKTASLLEHVPTGIPIMGEMSKKALFIKKAVAVVRVPLLAFLLLILHFTPLLLEPN